MVSRPVNVITRILAAVLSVLLVLFGIVLPVYSSLSTMFETKKLVKVVQKVEVKELLQTNDVITEQLEDSKLSDTLIDAFSKSALADKILEIYAEDIDNELKENGEPAKLNIDKVKELADEHIDELYELAKIDMKKDMSKAEFQKQVNKVLDKNGAEFIQKLPKPAEIKEMLTSKEVKSFTEVFANKTVVTVLAVATVLFAGLVYLCRFRKGKGFFWLMIDLSICGVVVLAIAFILNKATAIAESGMIAVPTTLIKALVSVYGEGLVLGGVLYLVAAAIFFAAWFICKKKQKV